MKKIITLSLFAALCLSAYADKLIIVSAGPGTPGVDQPSLYGMAISPNGKYISGSIENGIGYFVGEVGAEDVMYDIGDPEEEGNQLRNVDNNGLAIGVTDTGILYNMKGDLTVLDTPEGDFRYVIGEDLTNDGSMMIGTLVGVHSRAAYSTNGEDWTILPMPTPEQLGDIKLSDGSAAKYISADGKVILGHLGSFSIPVLWIRNDKGEYEVDFFPKNFLKETLDDDRVLYGLSAMYRAMSNNGRYVTSFGIIHDEHDSEKLILCRYDVQEKKMTYFPTDQTIDEFNKGLYPLAVSDDGTIIGTVGMPFFGSIGSFIMEAGQTQAKRFIDVFPDYAKKFTQEENYGFSTPTDISADGRYILGYTFYADDYLVTEGYQCTLTYVIDTKGDAGGVEAPVVDTQAVPEAYYSIDGRRVTESHKGVTIVRMSDGTVRKLITRE